MIHIEVRYDVDEYRAEAVAEEFVQIIILALQQYELEQYVEMEKLPACTVQAVGLSMEKPNS